MLYYLIVSVAFIISTPIYAKFEAHEWGTFTSLVGSDGLTQHGMYHEDEALPPFVHGFGETQIDFSFPQPPNDCAHMKFCFTPESLRNNVITQKMETPVIYFYGTPSSKDKKVSVNVKFPEGLITDTYPAPVSSSPKKSDSIQFKNGEVNFKVTVLEETDPMNIPQVDPQNIYGHARKTKSQLVQTNGEKEKFIFYRGLGRFQPRISITSLNGALSVKSNPNDQPRAAFLLHVSPQGEMQMIPLATASMTTSNGLVIHRSKLQQLKTHPSMDSSIVANSDSVKTALINALVESGMYKDEAQAMISTWENGYLRVPGLRMLYILPRSEVDQILPLNLTPAADTLERAFIARIEVMTDVEELQLVSQIAKEQLNFKIGTLGRFAEPMLRRVQQVYAQLVQNGKTQSMNISPNLHSVFSEMVQRSTTFSESTTTTIH